MKSNSPKKKGNMNVKKALNGTLDIVRSQVIRKHSYFNMHKNLYWPKYSNSQCCHRSTTNVKFRRSTSWHVRVKSKKKKGNLTGLDMQKLIVKMHKK